jgi:hypothetical protein
MLIMSFSVGSSSHDSVGLTFFGGAILGKNNKQRRSQKVL